MKTLNNHHTCYPYLSSAEGWEDEPMVACLWNSMSGCRAGPAWYQGAVVTLKPHFALCQNWLSRSSAPNELTKPTVLANRCSPTWIKGHVWFSLGSQLWMAAPGFGWEGPRDQWREEAGNPDSSKEWHPHFSWAVISSRQVLTGTRWQRFWQKCWLYV